MEGFLEEVGGVFGDGFEVAGWGEEGAGEGFVEGRDGDEHLGTCGPDVQAVGVDGEG